MVRFLAFGVGLDPRQGLLFGPKLGPFLTACALGLMAFATVGLAPGYPGAGMNPARCFAFAVARGEFSRKLEASRPAVFKILLRVSVSDMRGIDQWIWWVGPLTGSLLHTTVYHAVPPYHHEKRHEKRQRKTRVPV